MIDKELLDRINTKRNFKPKNKHELTAYFVIKVFKLTKGYYEVAKIIASIYPILNSNKGKEAFKEIMEDYNGVRSNS